MTCAAHYWISVPQSSTSAGMAAATLSRRSQGDGFAISLAEKDIALALESARSLAVPMPVTAAAHQHYVRARAAGLGDHVFFGTLGAVEAAAHVEVPARVVPARPTVPNAARVAGERYVERVNAADLDALVALFADDATVLHPLGAFTGRDAVRDFYATNILPHGPVLTASRWVVDGATCVFELAATTPRGTSNAIDHCTVDASGRIVRMAIAYR